jgi:hypothetical protein
MLSITRYAVEFEATFPNIAFWWRSTPSADNDVPPSASITARSRNTTPGS